MLIEQDSINRVMPSLMSMFSFARDTSPVSHPFTHNTRHNNPQTYVVFAEADLRSGSLLTQVSHSDNRPQFSMCHAHCSWSHVKFSLGVMVLFCRHQYKNCHILMFLLMCFIVCLSRKFCFVNMSATQIPSE